MNKQNLIDFVAEKANLTKKDATNAIDAVFEGIITGLKTSTDARFVGFGSFNLKAPPHAKVVIQRLVQKLIYQQLIVLLLKLGQSLKKQLINP